MLLNNLQKCLQYYQEMLKIRLFEKKVEFLFTKGLIHGTTHSCIGQEAVAVGVCSVLQPDDFVTSTHRGHGHAIAKKLPIKNLLAELLGKESGFCGGRGGTQHVISMLNNFIANGITGGSATTGTGIALAFKMQNSSKIVVSFFGDGAINEGHLHETINLAAVWKLPIIYVCENNLYAMSTATSETMIWQDIYKRAESYGLSTFCLDGNDLNAVQETMQQAVSIARQGAGPVFVECKTYRQCGHSKNDLCVYRTREEEEIWKKKDPLLSYKKRLINNQEVSEEQLEKIEQAVKEEIEEATTFALNSVFPRADTVWDNLWGGKICED